MSPAEDSRVVRRFHDEVINGNDWAVARDLLAPDVTHLRGAIGATLADIDPDGTGRLRDLTGAGRFIAATQLLRSHFPVWDSQILALVAGAQEADGGSPVVTRCLVRGQIGEGFRGGRDGQAFELDQAVIQRVRGGRIVEIWALADQLDFWRALGARGVGPAV